LDLVLLLLLVLDLVLLLLLVLVLLGYATAYLVVQVQLPQTTSDDVELPCNMCSDLMGSVYLDTLFEQVIYC